MAHQPFWESHYRNPHAPSPFGPPSEELARLVEFLPRSASILDLGCGDGRHSLFFSRHGCKVTAIDISTAAINKLSLCAARENLNIRAHVADLRGYEIHGTFDLIIAHGCLHLVERSEWARLIAEARAHTQEHGYNVIVVFTDSLPPPEDLRPWMKGLFTEGELFGLYSDWRVLTALSYILEDVHPGGIRHRHPINKIVAQRATPEAEGKRSSTQCLSLGIDF